MRPFMRIAVTLEAPTGTDRSIVVATVHPRSARASPLGSSLFRMRAQWTVLFMALGLVSLAIGLEHAPPQAATLCGRLMRSEPFHLVAHSVLYGSLAMALARRWFPPEALDGTPKSLRRRALSAALYFLFVAGAQELAQAVCRSRFPASEELFDLAVDFAGATLGLIVWSWFDGRRTYPVARALGVVLHPAFVGPLGVFALAWSTLRSGRAALGWTLLCVLAVLPLAGVWWVGLKRGWYSDRDLSVRTERPALLMAAVVSAALLVVAVHLGGAPLVVRYMTVAGLIATAFLTLATLAGTKVSGHVAVPVGVLVLLSATSYRGLWPFLLVALAVSWARVREGRHTPREVLAGWAIACASGIVAPIIG